MRRLNKVKIKWSPNFAYAIGLITTDGNLSPDNRHLNMTSKDKELIVSFKKCLGIKNKIGKKGREYTKEKKYFVVQFGDINFYNFLLSIGLTQAKSKTLSKINIPKKYFADFVRGCIDGDGNISISYHPQSNYPQLKIRLASGSLDFLKWIKDEIYKHTKTNGGWVSKDKSVFVLNYAKEDSIKLLNFMYYNGVYEYLERKYEIGEEFLYK